MITPSLALDFTTASLDARVTFTRTTGASNPATYVNNSGVITAATNNQPRFDYDPVTLACKGLLIEESRANAFTYSEQFNNADWLKIGLTVSIDAVSSPGGTTSADKIVENSGSVTPTIYRSFTFTSGTSYSYSVFAKADERFRLNLYCNGGYAFNCVFDLNAGTASGTGATITQYGNGWYRCSVSGVATSSVSANIQNRIYPTSGIQPYIGDGISGLYIWGAQLEAGAFPTSYIPTTTTALTRNADVATITGTNFSDWWNATQGGVTANFRPSTVSGTRPIIQYDDGTANEIIALRGNTTNPELYIVDDGTPQAQIDAGTIAANTNYALTGWWATNDCKAKLGSGAPVIDNTATIPTVTQARIGSDGTNYLNGHIASINYYDRFTSQIYNRRKNKAIFSLM